MNHSTLTSRAVFLFFNFYFFVAISFAGNINPLECSHLSEFQLTDHEKIDLTIARQSSNIFYINDAISFLAMDTACTSMASDTFFTTVIAGATSYNWTAPAGATITQLPGDTMIVVDWTTVSGTIPRADSICVSGENDCGEGSTSCVDIYIKNCNVAPVAIKDSLSVAENSTGNSILVQANDFDGNNDILTTTILDLPTSGGTASVVNGDSLVYAPPTDFFGLDTIRYQVCDPDNLCDTALVIINVLNDPCSPQDLANITSPGGSNSTTSIDLTADPVAAGFTGTWNIQSGGTGSESFLDINDESTTVSNLIPGVTYIFRWTVACDSNGAVSSFEEVTFCILTMSGMVIRRRKG